MFSAPSYVAASHGLCKGGRKGGLINTLHMRNMRPILGFTWSDRIQNNEILRRAATSSVYTLLRQRLLHWLGNVCRTQGGGIPKDLLYGELATGNRGQSRPQLRLKVVCKRDTKALGMDVDGQDHLAQDRSAGVRN